MPVGAADIVSARLEEAATTDLASLKWYTVRKGETLATIARNLRVSRTDLAEANYLRTTSRVATGQKLMVPHEATVLMTARAERPAPAAEPGEIATAAVVPAMASPDPERVKIRIQGEEWRYARVDRAGVQDDGRVTAGLEPYSRFRHQGW